MKAVEAAILCDAELTNSERLILYLLAFHANKSTWQARPSIARLVAESRQCRWVVLKGLKKLERENCIVRHPGGGRGKTTVYDLSPLKARAKRNSVAQVPLSSNTNGVAEVPVCETNSVAQEPVSSAETGTPGTQNRHLGHSETGTPGCPGPKTRPKRTHQDCARAREESASGSPRSLPPGVRIPTAVGRFLAKTKDVKSSDCMTDETESALYSMLQDGVDRAGSTAVNAALQELAVNPPSAPRALARYFRPILERHVKRARSSAREQVRLDREIRENEAVADQNQARWLAQRERLRTDPAAFREHVLCRARVHATLKRGPSAEPTAEEIAQLEQDLRIEPRPDEAPAQPLDETHGRPAAPC